MIYDEEYYKSNNYYNYFERKDRYKHLAMELSNLLNMLSYGKDQVILDYGCALGYLIQGFKDLDYKYIYGYEISEYCYNECINNNIIMLDNIDNFKTDIIISLDVFEHMKDEEIYVLFEKLSSYVIICRIPVAEPFSSDFYLEVSRNDSTHINCKTKNQWKNFLKQFGYNKFLHLNLFSIYDSKGVFSFMGFKND